MTRNNIVRAGLIGAMALLLWASAAGAAAADGVLKRAVFIPQWIPQAQHAGYYMALEKGFYRKRGIELEILRGGPNAPASELLQDGRADFGSLFLAKAIQLHANDRAVVQLAQLVHRSSIMLVAKKKNDILSVPDMEGKKVGLWGAEFQLQAEALFKRLRIRVHAVPQSTTVNLFLRDGVEVASAMWYNEYHTILNSGLDPEDLSTFFFFDYGLNFPEDGIYCLESTYRRDPDWCCRFVRASLEGWRYAFEHQEETLDVVMRYVDAVGIASNRIHQRWMLARMRDLMTILANGLPDPRLQPRDYALVGRELQDAGLIEAVPAYTRFIVDCMGHVER